MDNIIYNKEQKHLIMLGKLLRWLPLNDYEMLRNVETFEIDDTFDWVSFMKSCHFSNDGMKKVKKIYHAVRDGLCEMDPTLSLVNEVDELFMIF